MSSHLQLTLRLDAAEINPDSPIFHLSSWPPRADTPVTLDEVGNVLSSYADPVWDISHHCKSPCRLYFRDSPDNPKSKVTPENGALFRLCMAWWWWGPQAVMRARELEARFRALRPIFEICSANGIAANQLHKFPRVVRIYKDALKPSQARAAIRLLHDIFEARDHLGFFLLTRDQITELSRRIPAHTKTQTPYIPPRIWQLLANRTRTIIDEFISLSDEFGRLYWANVESRIGGVPSDPINNEDYPAIADAMNRWLIDHGDGSPSVYRISSYASLVALCCHIQIVFYSLMRVDEAWRLPRDCFISERDSVGELVFSVRGDTTKTVVDSDARWIVSESASSAVAAADKIASLRLKAGIATGMLGSEADSLRAPLFPRSYEPWTASAASATARFLSVRQASQELKRQLLRHKIFAEGELTITEDDMRVCRLLNPSADPKIYAVDKPWPLAWHQLRRTGAVNMHSSGHVSDASIQYQLKHAQVAMSRYYGRGHYLLSSPVNDLAKQEYVRTMYEMLAYDFSKLSESTFVSPYGDQHKTRILNLISPEDHRNLLIQAKKGSIAYREHLLGGCASPIPCDKGGFESVAACAGNGKPCEWLLYDKRKMKKYEDLHRDITERQKDAAKGEPLREALDAQVRAVRGAIEACESDDAA